MEPVPIEFISEGDRVCGRFYAAEQLEEPVTFLYIPGWPGDADDYLGLGPQLSRSGINMAEFAPRGLVGSEGICTHASTMQDIASALHWLARADVQKRFKVNPEKLVLGGYSYGGGMAMAYAAHDPGIHRVISIAGTDHGELGRELQRNAELNTMFRAFLRSTRVPDGPARFDIDSSLQEFFDHPEVYGLKDNASKLADRAVLLIGGWEDKNIVIEYALLPLYRALKGADAKDVTFVVYHADHSFGNVRQRLASDIAGWILAERKD